MTRGGRARPRAFPRSVSLHSGVLTLGAAIDSMFIGRAAARQRGSEWGLNAIENDMEDTRKARGRAGTPDAGALRFKHLASTYPVISCITPHFTGLGSR